MPQRRRSIETPEPPRTARCGHPNGLLTVDSYQWNELGCFAALRPRALVVVEDTQGRAIWVSDEFEFPTRCPVCDFTCPGGQEGGGVRLQQFPDHPQPGPVIGMHAVKLVIYQYSEESGVSLRDRWVKAIKDATDIAGPLIELAKLFL